MDTVTPIVLAVGAGAAAMAVRGRRLRDPWNFMELARANNRRQVLAEDGVLGGSTQQAFDRLAEKHFGGSFDDVTIGDLFPVLCSPNWEEATAGMLGCLMRHNRIPRSFRPPAWGQYQLLRAYWVPRPSRRHHYARPGTALDYLDLANLHAALPVQAEDGAIERVPADWFRGYLQARNWPGDEAPIQVLLSCLRPDQNSSTWWQDSANARSCVTGRLKRQAVLDPDFDDDVPALQPDRFAATFRALSLGETPRS